MKYTSPLIMQRSFVKQTAKISFLSILPGGCLRNWILVMFMFYAWTSNAQGKNVLPVTPEAAALAKMVNFPVDMSRGVPDINIPFYEILAGGMCLPIRLDYHSGGFKINERSTRTGLGWSLSCDLQITRSVNGKDDFSGYIVDNQMKAFYSDPSEAYNHAYPIMTYSSFFNTYYMTTGERDGSPDKFNFKLLNKSGSFYFQKSGAGNTYTIVPVPYDNIRISYSNGQFTIIDTDGTTYYFGQPGTGAVPELLTQAKEVTGNLSGGVVTAWKCLRVLAPNQIDEISFSYTAKAVNEFRSFSDYVEFYSNDNPCNLDTYYRSDQLPMSNISDYNALTNQVAFYKIHSPKYMEVFAGSTTQKFHVPYLNAQNQVVDKVYDWNNAASVSTYNVYGLSISQITFRGGSAIFNGADQLESIRIQDSEGAELKTLFLSQSFVAAPSPSGSSANGPNFPGTMYLDALSVRNGSAIYERYALLYNNKYCYGNHLKGHDAWGYANLFTSDLNQNGSYPGYLQTIPRRNIIQPRYYFGVGNGCTNFVQNIPLSIGSWDFWSEAASEDAMRRGVLRRIIYPTGGAVDFDFEANRYMAHFVGSNRSQWLPQQGGGLRIRSISYYQPDANKPYSQKYYRYGDLEDGNGISLTTPNITDEPYRYYFGGETEKKQVVYLQGNMSGQGCLDRSCLTPKAVENKTTYRPASSLSYTHADGSNVYYTKVTEYKQDLGQQTGRTVYEYYPPDQFLDNWSKSILSEIQIPGTTIPFLKVEGMMGAQKSVSEYSYDIETLQYKISRKKSFEYTPLYLNEQLRVVYVQPLVEYSVVEGNFGGDQSSLYDYRVGFANSAVSPPSNEYIYGQYGIPVGRLLLSRETEELYSGGLPVTTTVNYEYSDLPYLQPSAIQSTDSKGQTIKKLFKYPYNEGGVYAGMVLKNMISMPVEITENNIDQNKEISHTRTEYALIQEGNGFYAPIWTKSSVQGSSLRLDISYDRYDAYGNVLQVSGRDGIPVSYLWGYNALYPLAELRGVAYSAIPATYQNNTGLISPGSDSALQSLLDGLRTTFSGEQQVRTLTYKRLVGQSSQTSIGGLRTSYKYDAIGRLQKTLDQNGKVIREYSYNLIGPKASSMTPLSANVPMMRTHNYFYGAMDLIKNVYVPGGTYTSAGNAFTVNELAEQDLENFVYPPPPASYYPTNMVKVKLLSQFLDFYDYPHKVEIDFVRDGSIVASRDIDFNNLQSSPLNITTFFVPPGVYKLSFRISADVRYDDGFFTDYSIKTVGDANPVYIASGAQVTLDNTKEYEITVNNYR